MRSESPKGTFLFCFTNGVPKSKRSFSFSFLFFPRVICGVSGDLSLSLSLSFISHLNLFSIDVESTQKPLHSWHWIRGFSYMPCMIYSKKIYICKENQKKKKSKCF